MNGCSWPGEIMNVHKLFFIYRKLDVFEFFGYCRHRFFFSFIFAPVESCLAPIYVLFCVCAYLSISLFHFCVCDGKHSIPFAVNASDNEPLVNRNYSAFVDNLINDLENETVRIE